jgi:hypothetical protein
MIVIDIGGSRATLLKLADDIHTMFAGKDTEDGVTLYGTENTLDGQSEVQIRFSNEDMEDRDDIPSDAVFVDLEYGAR